MKCTRAVCMNRSALKDERKKTRSRCAVARKPQCASPHRRARVSRLSWFQLESMMKNHVARFRQSGSFIAGLLIGIAVVFAAFAATEGNPGAWQTFLLFGAPVILVIGFALQVLVTSRPRPWLAASA